MRMPFHERIFCTVPDALDALSLGRTKFYELVSRGDIKITKVDSRTLVIVDSLKKLASPVDPAAMKTAA